MEADAAVSAEKKLIEFMPFRQKETAGERSAGGFTDLSDGQSQTRKSRSIRKNVGKRMVTDQSM